MAEIKQTKTYKRQQILVRMQKREHLLTAGKMQTSTTTMDISVEVLLKAKNRSTT